MLSTGSQPFLCLPEASVGTKVQLARSGRDRLSSGVIFILPVSKYSLGIEQ
jgi:hypothetical protein